MKVDHARQYEHVADRPGLRVGPRREDEEEQPRLRQVAVPVTGDEYERIDGEHARVLAFKLLTGFPPRRILRLDPR